MNRRCDGDYGDYLLDREREQRDEDDRERARPAPRVEPPDMSDPDVRWAVKLAAEAGVEQFDAALDEQRDNLEITSRAFPHAARITNRLCLVRYTTTPEARISAARAADRLREEMMRDGAREVELQEVVIGEQQECSICRRRHGSEIRHACE